MEERTTVVIDIQLDQDRVADELAAVNREMAALRAENAAMKKEVKDGTKTWEDVSAALAQNEARLKSLKASQSALSSQVVQSTRKSLEYGTSLKEQSALLSELRNRYQSLNATERESAQGQALLKHIQDLDAAIKAADYSQGQFQRNVGNYPAAVQPLREELEKLTKQLEDLRSENKEGSDEFAAVEKRIGEVNQSITQLTGKVEGLATDTGNVRQQMRELTENLIAMKMRGEENTEQYRQMLEQLGKMKDAMQDTNTQVKQMASDTSTLNSVLAGAQAAAGAFSVAMGVMNLVGDKDSETAKELAEAQMKLQSAIAITTGLQALQNALQKESALMMGVNRIKMLAAAAAQRVYSAATKDAATSQKVFNAIAESNPYILLAGLILTAAGAIYAFTSGSKEQEEQLNKVNYELKNQVEVLQRLSQGYADISRRVEDSMEGAIESAREQGKSLEEIRRLEDGLFEVRKARMDKEKEDYQWLNDNLVTYENKYSETTTKIRQLDAEYMEALRNGNKERAEFYLDEINSLNNVADAIKKRLDAVNDFNNRYSQLLRDRQAQEAQRAKEDEEAEKRKEEEAKRNHEKRMARLKEEREATIAAYKEMLDNIPTATELAEREAEANERLAQSIQKVADHVGLMAEEFEQLPKPEDIPLISDAGLTDATSQLDLFAESYKENAQSIQETSSALQSSFQSLSSMYQQMANDESKTEEEREKAARKAKAWAAIQVASNAGAAIAKGVASAVDVGFPAAIPAIATMTATILAAIAQAKAMLSQMGGFETGGVIGGYRGATMGRDNTAISARTGEMVLNAKQQRQLFEIANGGMSTNLTASLVEALQAMPAPVLVYSEFQRFTDRVATLDDAAKLQ